MEVTYYEPIIVDRLNSAPNGRASQLWLPLVGLCALGSRFGVVALALLVMFLAGRL